MHFLTPGTSLFIANSTGYVEERLYMAWLAKKIFGISSERAIQVFQCNASSFGRSFEALTERTEENGKFLLPGPRIFARLHKTWSEHLECLKEGNEASFRTTVKAMRLQLARIMLESLDPDLIILDEFQKFKDILMPDVEDINDQKNICPYLVRPEVATLLLSATPYRLLAQSGHPGDIEDVSHYDEFLKVLTFLTGNKERALSLLKKIHGHGRNIRSLSDATWRKHLHRLISEKTALEAELTLYISRTERVFFQHSEQGSVETRFMSEQLNNARISRNEIKEFLLLARKVSRKELLAYWKSGSYLMSYLQEYVLGKTLRRTREVAGNRFLYTSLNDDPPRNRKIEYVAEDVFKTDHAFKYLWIPPLKPYYQGRGIYHPEMVKRADVKKGLVFSSWQFVPRQVAVELSRLRDNHFRTKNLSYQMKVTPVTWANFFYPSELLAQILTHEDFVNNRSLHELELLAKARIIALLTARGIETNRSIRNVKTWEVLRYLEFVDDPKSWRDLIGIYRKPVSRSRQRDEKTFHHMFEPRYLTYLDKPFPEHITVNSKIIDELVSICLGSPAIVLLRGLLTISGSKIVESKEFMAELGRLCLIELRSFVSRSATVQCVRAVIKRGSYARRLSEYFLDGNFQAVIDEYLFCIGGGMKKDSTSEKMVLGLLDKLRQVFQYRKSVLMPYRGKRARHRVNTHIAMAFGESEEGGVSRDDLRVAFNSPFWPFVLATTSVGQEGLDFHLYCKNIYHWNLPSSPVDFEQREGRLNRFNSLTIREAIISLIGSTSISDLKNSTFWQCAFDLAPDRCHYNDRYNLGLSPNWICTPTNNKSGSQLMRHVLDLPHSSDRRRYNKLMDRLRLYRLALGQPNPDKYLQLLEKNGFLKKIDTRSLYLNLFPFTSFDKKDRLIRLLDDPNRIRLMLEDAIVKASELPSDKNIGIIRKLVRKASENVSASLNFREHTKPVKLLVEALLDFVDIHDKINDRVPIYGYKDDLSRLIKACQCI
jgi:hypothetical protein